MSKSKNYKKTKQAWSGYELAERHQRIHSKIMHCLPKHKLKLHQKLMSQIIKRKFNFSEQFAAGFEKLTKLEQAQLTAEQPRYLPM